MMKEPWFWREKTLAARIVAASLAPAAALYNMARRLQMAAAHPYPAPLPVICVGNATVGGVGKTPFALMLAKLLKARGLDAHFLTRGYGGKLKGPVKVDPDNHDAAAVGDEALLLAAAAPTWIARDRPAGALAANLAGADAVIMDDGFQNPALEKTFSFLLADAADPAGNGRLLPAGPLREPENEAIARASAYVFVLGKESAPRPSPPAEGLPVFHAWLTPLAPPEPCKVLAFCGIARPERFFASLDEAGCEIVEAVGFPDHHAFSEATILRLRKLAAARGARLMTTEKDFVRMPPSLRKSIDVFRMEMTTDNPEALAALAVAAVSRFREKERARND